MHHQHSLRHRIETFLIILFIVLLGCTIAAFSAPYMMDGPDAPIKKEKRFALAPSEGHEPIKASVVDNNPKSFKINVRKFANIGVDEEAPTFVVYVKRSLPTTCGDFRKMKLPYKKPSEYEREFNLSRHKEVLAALDTYGCVVMRNIPPAKG